MIERLFIWLGRTFEHPCAWMVWSDQEQEIIASGELPNAGELASLRERAGGRPVEVLLSSAALTLTQVTLPEKGQRQALKALPFMLEEQLVDDVTQMHFVVGPREGEQLTVVVVTHEQMQHWLEWLKDAELKPRVLVPDCLALPLVDNQCAVMQFGSDCLLRTSYGAGHSVPMDWLKILLPKLLPEQDEPVTLATYTRMDLADLTLADTQLEVHEQALELPLQVLARGIVEAPINLLTGVYKPKREYSKHLLLWRNAAIVAGIAIVLALMNKGINIYQMDKQAAGLKTQSEAIYRTAIPGSKRIVNLRTQMKGELKKLQGKSGGDELFAMLQSLAPSFTKVPELKPDSLRFDGNRGELRLQVSAKNYDQIEKFRELAGKDFNVSAGAMNSKHDAVTSTLTIRSM